MEAGRIIGEVTSPETTGIEDLYAMCMGEGAR
jgi:hypothetical protein